ncbi:SAM-dependent methyltransferase [Actinomadura rubrobrunea]|uniref:SAM-dependent methyltransferase n=1 Tax=Actinomadura rubrobrunea TaxID=115335 RepID=A0A9W6PRS0_9ACTN|nr:class I SAM-dependent methyltransferase [Actinomadura rubrobrunea]GLW61899.1 SAM-dependent methyltransferase [Actinomadura rubrobrunea]
MVAAQRPPASTSQDRPDTRTPPRPHRATLARSVRLLRAFRREQHAPADFYRLLARDTVEQVRGYARLDGATVLDVGTGTGFLAREFHAAGARCAGVDLDVEQLTALGSAAGCMLAGSAMALPFQDGAFDVCVSSNVLEHVREPWRMGAEMIRVTRPGGVVYLAFTPWLSPWGGHETSPWHYLGGERAARRYERKYGRPPKNRFGETLHRVTVAEALTWARAQRDVDVLDVIPRYHPSWAKGVVRVPGLREFASWNVVLVLRRRHGAN